LKTSTVTFAEGKTSGRTVRQGEWFFVNATPDEETEIKMVIRKKARVIQKKMSLHMLTGTRGGKPHVVDEAIKMLGMALVHGFSVRGAVRDEVFVRGRVRHADHKTVSFSSWRKVIRNNEPGQASGIRWID